MERRPFVLSGGGARGAAHIGVLKAFSEAGIIPSVIAATSAGAIVGALICDGYEADDILEVIATHKIFDSFSWRSPLRGTFSLEPLRKMLQTKLTAAHFEELKTPLFITATNYISGEQQVFSTGPLIPAILAACSIPMVFAAVVIDEVPYVDGGISNNLPVEPLVGKYADIIGVHVNPLPRLDPKAGFSQRLDRTLHLTIRPSTMRSKVFCSQFIEPAGLEKFGMFDAKKTKQIAAAGYDHVKKLFY